MPIASWKSMLKTPDGRDHAHSAADFLDLQRMNQSFDAVAGYREDLIAVSAKPGEPVQLTGVYVTAAFFDVLSVRPSAGRGFEHATPGDKLFVISDDTWRKEFGADPSAVGRSVRLNGVPYQLAGVLPARVRWPEGAGLWILSPKSVPPSPVEHGDDPNTRDVQYFYAIARLRSNVSLQTAQVEMTTLSEALRTKIRRYETGGEAGSWCRCAPLSSATFAWACSCFKAWSAWCC